MRGLVKLLVAGVAGALVAVTATVTLPAVSSTPVQNTDTVKISGCAVRLVSKPYLHRNATHSCAGFTRARYDWKSGRVVVYFDGGVVRSVTVSADETLTARGITCGGSGGGAWLSVQCYSAELGKPIRYDTTVHGRKVMQGPLSNLWVTIISESS